MSRGIDDALLTFNTPHAAPGTAIPRAHDALSTSSDDQELPEQSPLTTSSAPATARNERGTTEPAAVGATLTCTRCRRHFDAFFADDASATASLAASSSEADRTARFSRSLGIHNLTPSGQPSEKDEEMRVDGLCASESSLVGSTFRDSDALSRVFPISEVVELHRRRRERVTQRGCATRTTTDVKVACDQSEGSAVPCHPAVRASVQTAAGAYHPLQPSLFSPWLRCERRCGLDHTGAKPSSDKLRVETRHATGRCGRSSAADRALIADLPRVLSNGTAWLRAPAARDAYLRHLWSRRVTAYLTDVGASPKARDELAHDIISLYDPVWREVEQRSLASVTEVVTGAPSPTSRATSCVDAARLLPTPIPADAITVQAMDFPETVHAHTIPSYASVSMLGRMPVPPPPTGVATHESTHEDAEDYQVHDGVFELSAPLSPMTLRTRRKQAACTHNTVPTITERLHKRWWHQIAAESGANAIIETVSDDAATPWPRSCAAVRLLPPLCTACWSGEGLTRASAAATSAYADAVDFTLALHPRHHNGDANNNDRNRDDGNDGSCATRHRVMSGAPSARPATPPTPLSSAPLWRTAVASLLAEDSSSGVGRTSQFGHNTPASIAPSSQLCPPPTAATSSTCAQESSLTETLATLRTQRADLEAEAAALTSRLAALHRTARDTLLPRWNALVEAANVTQVVRFTEEGGDDARGRLQQIEQMARSECFLRHLSILRLVFLIDVSGPFGRIAGLRLGTAAPYTATSSTPSLPPHPSSRHDTCGARRFVVPNVDSESRVLVPSTQTDELREILAYESRQIQLTQTSLSGVANSHGSALSASSEDVVGAAETNTACGYLLQLLNRLAKVNRVVFSRAVLHPRGDASIVDILKPLSASASDHAGVAAAQGVDSSSTSGGWFSWGWATSSTPPPPQQQQQHTREVERTVDFHIKTSLLTRKTFGSACVTVLGCLKELCERLTDALRTWRRQQLAGPARAPPPSSQVLSTTSPPLHASSVRSQQQQARESSIRAAGTSTADVSSPWLSFPHLGRDMALVEAGPSSEALEATAANQAETQEQRPPRPVSLMAHAQVSVTLDPPFPMGLEGTIDGFSVQHGSVSEAVWSLAMKKLLANALWCVQATVELQRLYGQ